MNLHQQIRQARIDAGLTLTQAASLLHMHPSTLQRYECGKITHISYQTLLAISFCYQQPAFTASVNALSGEDLLLSTTAPMPSSSYQLYCQLDARGRQLIDHMIECEYRRLFPNRPPQNHKD